MEITILIVAFLVLLIAASLVDRVRSVNKKLETIDEKIDHLTSQVRLLNKYVIDNNKRLEQIVKDLKE